MKQYDAEIGCARLTGRLLGRSAPCLRECHTLWAALPIHKAAQSAASQQFEIPSFLQHHTLGSTLKFAANCAIVSKMTVAAIFK
jgi:hypothetical protein